MVVNLTFRKFFNRIPKLPAIYFVKVVIVIVFLLLGDGSGPYVRSVVLNVGELVSIISSEAIIGIALVLLAWFMIPKINK